MSSADLIVIDPIELERITKEVLLEYPAHRVPAEVLRRCSATAPKVTAADRRRADAAVAHAIKKRAG
jgi:hypothetical protein